MGTFHSVSRKHLPNYLNEFQFRWNTRKLDDGRRVSAAIQTIIGKRLEYRESVDNPPYLVQSAPAPEQMDAEFPRTTITVTKVGLRAILPSAGASAAIQSNRIAPFNHLTDWERKMAYDARQIATEFIQLAQAQNKKLTPMQLQKLVYFAYGWYLAITGERLINERVGAWQWGPVFPSLYSAFREYGSDPIDDVPGELVFEGTKLKVKKFPLISDDPKRDEMARSIIRRVWEIYGNYSASALSGMTHEPNSPWAQTTGKDIRGTYIEDDLIEDYFRRLANERPVAASK